MCSAFPKISAATESVLCVVMEVGKSGSREVGKSGSREVVIANSFGLPFVIAAGAFAKREVSSSFVSVRVFRGRTRAVGLEILPVRLEILPVEFRGLLALWAIPPQVLLGMPALPSVLPQVPVGLLALSVTLPQVRRGLRPLSRKQRQIPPVPLPFRFGVLALSRTLRAMRPNLPAVPVIPAAERMHLRAERSKVRAFHTIPRTTCRVLSTINTQLSTHEQIHHS